MALAPTYNPKDFETDIYRKWQAAGVGSPETQNIYTPKPAVLFATTNNHKIKLFKLAWASQGLAQKYDLLTLKDLQTHHLPEVLEDSGTFAGDALLKAKIYANHFKLPVISQDRGFIFDVLGWPGTDSKKVMFGTENVVWRDDHQWLNEKDANTARVQAALSKIAGRDRSMRVVQGLAMALPDEGPAVSDTFEILGKASEKVVNTIGGTFDWFFIPDGLNHILAEFADQQMLDDYASKYMYPITPVILDFLQENIPVNTDYYSILMPPPNLTGDLHAGHAFQHYIMDTLTRIHRQQGQQSLWYPGVDHAGIQLEGVIDKLIKKGEFDEILEQKIPDFQATSREDLPKHLKDNHKNLWTELAWSKVNTWRDNQKKQSSVLGDTPDYSRSLFTLDDRANQMVYYAFQKYWEDGLIYKSSYLINWSVGLQTAVSDVAGEIEYEKRLDPFITFEYKYLFTDLGFMDEGNYLVGNSIEQLKVKLDNFFESNSIQVSTVRPETIFGDVALAIHPQVFKKMLLNSGDFDKNEVNKIIELIKNGLENKVNRLEIYFTVKPLQNIKARLIIADEVDPDFGTGALKITPASDLVDYEIFNKYIGGDFPSAVGRDGKLTEICGNYAGLTIEQGRLATIKTLIQSGFVPLKDEFILDTEIIHEEIASKQIELEHFDPTDYSYTEGQKRLQEILGENVLEKLQIDWQYEHNVSICERSKTVIEPLISEEFFLSYHRPVSQKDKLEDEEYLLLGGREWQLNFRTLEQLEKLNQILDGTKSMEVRALNPEEPDRYFGYISPQDIIEFVDNVQDKTYRRLAKNVEIYKNLEEAHERGLDFGLVFPEIHGNYTLYDIKQIVMDKLGQEYLDKIQANGLVAIEITTFPVHNLQSIGLAGLEETQFYPSEIQDRARNFLENIKDWCISRNLVWGHQIPVWYNLDLNPTKIFIAAEDVDKISKIQLPLDEFLTQKSLLEPYFVAEPKIVNHPTGLQEYEIQVLNSARFAISSTKPTTPGNWVQEEKILDTWFSSCLWPLSTLGFYDFQNGQPGTDFSRFYPTVDMVTGVDIFYQWIIRMMVVCKYFTGSSPYQNVILNPTVRDEQGRKMSKSLGNGLDAVSQIDKYSSDSLRLAMLSGMFPNRNFRLGGRIADQMCEKYRNFGNKLWNVARFLKSRSG